MPDEPLDDDARQADTDRDDSDRSNGEESIIGFTLPPITFPPLRLPSIGLPADFSPIPPVFERVRGSRNLVLAALAIDTIDIIVLLAGGSGFVPVTVGTILAVGLVYPLGGLYAWEFIPVLWGLPWLGVVPSATLLVLLDRSDFRTD